MRDGKGCGMGKMRNGIAGVFASILLAICLAGCAQAEKGETEGASSQIEGDAPAKVGEGAQMANDGVRSYVVARIDGEPDWSAAPVLDIDNQQWLDPVDISAHAQLCYGDDAFYVRMWAEEADIRAEYPADDLLADTYEDSCLEFFLSPVAGDTRYLNFEFNPNCAVGAQIGTEKANRTRLVRTDDVYAASSARTEDGWEITYKLPFDFIRQFYPDFTAESGDVLRGNFYKCGNLTASKHYLSWNPIDSDTPNFHVPECFGELVLE